MNTEYLEELARAAEAIGDLKRAGRYWMAAGRASNDAPRRKTFFYAQAKRCAQLARLYRASAAAWSETGHIAQGRG